MRIQKILNQHRRDFTAIYECESCGHTHEGSGYDDSYFHNEVVPNKKCPACGKTAPADTRSLAPRYDDSVVV